MISMVSGGDTGSFSFHAMETPFKNGVNKTFKITYQLMTDIKNIPYTARQLFLNQAIAFLI